MSSPVGEAEEEYQISPESKVEERYLTPTRSLMPSHHSVESVVNVDTEVESNVCLHISRC